MFNSIENFVLSITLAISTVWIVDRFWRSFFDKKKQNVFSIVVWIIFCIFQLYFDKCIKGNINIPATIINILLILLISICGYNSKGKLKYFLLLVFCSVWSLFETLVFFLINTIPIEISQLDIVGAVISKILMMIFVYILPLVTVKKLRVYISNKYHFFLLLIPTGSIFIAVMEFYSLNNAFYSMITISILLLFNVVIFEIYIKLNEIFIYEKERTVYAQQFDIIAKSTAGQEKLLEEFHEEKHNLINKLIVLKNSIEESDKESVIVNINKIIDSSHVSEIISNCGNSTIDALINFKYAIAKEYGIIFKLKIFIPEVLPIEQCDIGVVLGNAIDNAIDATKECKTKEKFIEISMGVKKQAWIMKIKNPYEIELRKDRYGNFLSTKKDKHRHGFGLLSIKKIAEKYQGEVITEAESNIFILTVVLNLKNI